ncbi:SLAIN motif-containing protein 1-like isoform X2 [Stigmatopora argus]
MMAAVADPEKNQLYGEQHLSKLQQLVQIFERYDKRLPTWNHRNCRPVAEFQKHGRHQPLILEQVDLLDLDTIGFSDNETWLYVSPKAKKLTTENTITLVQWCRHFLDAPEWKLARRSICLKLESASWRQRLLSSPQATSTSPTVPTVSPNGTGHSDTHRSNFQLTDTDSPNSQSPIGRPRTRTFIPHCGSRLRYSSPRPRMNSDVLAPVVDEEDALIPHGYKLLDITDVQVVARLQEEKLKEAYASTLYAPANRRSQSVTLPLSVPRGQEEEEKGDGEDSAPVQPKCCLCPLPHTHTSSAQDWQNCNLLSMPPYASPTHQPFKPRADEINLAQFNSVPSASLRDSPGCSTPLQSPMSTPVASPNMRQTKVQSTGSVSSSPQQSRATVSVSPTTVVHGSQLQVGSSRIPMLSKCSSLALSSPRPRCSTYFNDSTSPISGCKMAKPGLSCRSMLRCFST